ncbi:MAG: aspartyl protease family protein [Ferruginibacter sp.]
MKKNILLLTLVLFFVFCRTKAIGPIQPAAKYITSFYFQQFSEGVIIVKALLNNVPDTLNFILDTGCGGISLDSTTCSILGIKTIPSDITITGMGEAHKVNFVFHQTLHLPGLTLHNVNFHVNDYSVLSGVYGEKIDGVIGSAFFNHYIVKIDFDSLRIDVYSPGKIKYSSKGTLLHPYFNNIPVQTLKLQDARKINFNFYFDTGAGLCFLMNKNFVNDSGILLKTHHPLLTQADGLGGRLQMHLTIIKKLKVGSYIFRNIPSYIYDDIYNVTSYPSVGGLVGIDLLRRFNMIINYPKDEIDLWPNGHFNDKFDYAYTGLSLYYSNEQILVDDIISESPAEEAGLQKDDIVLSVENNTSNNIQQYKTLLQSPNEKIKITINRNGTLLILFIKPKLIS